MADFLSFIDQLFQVTNHAPIAGAYAFNASSPMIFIQPEFGECFRLSGFNLAALARVPFAPREIDKFNVIASVKFGTLKDLTPISGISG